MELSHLFLLLGAGLTAGFVAGLIGVGGGVIFAPVLFFYYQSIGVPPEIIAPLTIGSSLFCTLLAAVSSAWTQYRRNAVIVRMALTVGAFSALAVFLLTRFVTTQPWYDGAAFQAVFSLVLLFVVGRMVFRKGESEAAGEEGVRDTSGYPGDGTSAVDDEIELATEGSGGVLSADDVREDAVAAADRQGWPSLAAAGTVAGAVSAAAGVGGGVVLVPAYSQFMRMPMRIATGTSSATIVLISLVGVIHYAVLGAGETTYFGAVGYVDAVRALLLAVPSLLTANLGVRAAHRINQRALRLSFAAIAGVVAVRLLYEAVG